MSLPDNAEQEALNQNSQVNSQEGQPAENQQPAGEQAVQGREQGGQQAQNNAVEQVSDNAFAQYYSNIQQGMGQNFGNPQMPFNSPAYQPQHPPQYPQFNQGYDPFSQQQGFQQQSPHQFYQPQQQFQQPQQEQQPSQQQEQQQSPQPKQVEINYDDLGKYLDDGDGKGFAEAIDKIVQQRTDLTVSQQKEEVQRIVNESVNQNIQKQFQQQQEQQTINSIVNGVQQELVKNNINLNQWQQQALMSQVDQTVVPMYQNYIQNYNALKSSGQLNPASFPVNKDGSPLSGIDFAINYSVQLATQQSGRNVNTQAGTPNNVVRQNMNPVVSGQGNPPQAKTDWTNMPDEEFLKNHW